MKKFLIISVLFTIIFGSCKKEDNIINEYVGLFDENFIADLDINNTNSEQAKNEVFSVFKLILDDNDINSERQITIYHFGYTDFGFYTTFTAREARILGKDSRIKALSQNLELVTSDEH